MIGGPSPSSRWSPPLSEATSSSAICARPSLAPPRRAFIFPDMRALALDVGSKTIGLAMTDEAMIAAHPLTVLQRIGKFGDAQAIVAVAAEHGVTDVVIGMPFELSGKIGHRARRVGDFASALRAGLAEATVKFHDKYET